MFRKIKAERFGVEFSESLMQVCKDIAEPIKTFDIEKLNTSVDVDFEIIALVYTAFFTAMKKVLVDSSIFERVIFGFTRGILLDDYQKSIMFKRMMMYVNISKNNKDDKHFEKIGKALTEILFIEDSSIISAHISMNYLQAFAYAFEETKRFIKVIE